MIQFTVRDLIWAMMVAAFGLCWYMERDGRQGLRERAMVLHQENEKLRIQQRTASRYRLRCGLDSVQVLREMVDKLNADRSAQAE